MDTGGVSYALPDMFDRSITSVLALIDRLAALPSSRALSSEERSFIEDVAFDADDKRSTYGQKTVKRLLAIIDRLTGAPSE
jgi:hypothetical protein